MTLSLIAKPPARLLDEATGHLILTWYHCCPVMKHQFCMDYLPASVAHHAVALYMPPLYIYVMIMIELFSYWCNHKRGEGNIKCLHLTNHSSLIPFIFFYGKVVFFSLGPCCPCPTLKGFSLATNNKPHATHTRFLP